MDKRIIYESAEGNCCVVVPAPNCTMEQLIAAVPSGIPYDIVEMAEIPSDRTFRNGWKKGDKKVDFDMVKCKNIAHDKRREKREKELSPLDKQITEKYGKKTEQDAIEAQREVIRAKYVTIQAQIDACTTVAELKAIIDAEGL